MKKKSAAKGPFLSFRELELRLNPLERIAAFRKALEASEVEDRDYFIEALKEIEAGADPKKALGLKKPRGRSPVTGNDPEADEWIRHAWAVVRRRDEGMNYEQAIRAACADLYPEGEPDGVKERSIKRHYDELGETLRGMREGRRKAQAWVKAAGVVVQGAALCKSCAGPLPFRAIERFLGAEEFLRCEACGKKP